MSSTFLAPRGSDIERLPIFWVVVLNLVPVAGVVLWGWRSFDVVFLYWFENVLIGLMTLGRMLIRQHGGNLSLAGVLFKGAFFTVHYGMFCAGHGVFVFALFGADEAATAGLLPAILETLSDGHMLLAAAALTGLQLLDWQREVARDGWGSVSPDELMMRPYGRIIILHLAIIGGGLLVSALQEPLAGLLVLIALKTWVDLAHWRRRIVKKNKDANEK